MNTHTYAQKRLDFAKVRMEETVVRQFEWKMNKVPVEGESWLIVSNPAEGPAPVGRSKEVEPLEITDHLEN